MHIFPWIPCACVTHIILLWLWLKFTDHFCICTVTHSQSIQHKICIAIEHMKTLSSIQLNVSYLNIIVNKKPCTKGWKLLERESKKKYSFSHHSRFSLFVLGRCLVADRECLWLFEFILVSISFSFFSYKLDFLSF